MTKPWTCSWSYPKSVWRAQELFLKWKLIMSQIQMSKETLWKPISRYISLKHFSSILPAFTAINHFLQREDPVYILSMISHKNVSNSLGWMLDAIKSADHLAELNFIEYCPKMVDVYQHCCNGQIAKIIQWWWYHP